MPYSTTLIMLHLGALAILPTALAFLPWQDRLHIGDQRPLQGPHTSQGYDPFISEHFDKFVNDTLREFLTPGLAIAVVRGNDTFTKANGYADLDSQEPMTPRTLFFTGSTTKSFTAAAASQLVYSNASQYEHIDWNTKLVDLIRDDFVLQDDWVTNHITLTDALSHRTGMPRHDFSWSNRDPSVREVVRGMRYLPLNTEIRTAWEYCNLMFIAVGHALETVTRTALGTLLKDRIWNSLGMRETFYSINDALDYSAQIDGVVMSTGYMYDNETRTYVAQPISIIPPPTGAGSIISNVHDYTNWIRTFLHPENSPVQYPRKLLTT